jgi:hypothetical protein
VWVECFDVEKDEQDGVALSVDLDGTHFLPGLGGLAVGPPLYLDALFSSQGIVPGGAGWNKRQTKLFSCGVLGKLACNSQGLFR